MCADSPGADVEKLTPQEFYAGAGKRGAVLATTPPKDWTMYGLTRGEDGSYPDTILAEILNDAIDAPAGAFGAHGSPACLRVRLSFFTRCEALLITLP